MKRVSILGTVGVPARYGGFETLADNLVSYAYKKNLGVSLAVYCSGKSKGETEYLGAKLRFVPVKANGVSSILYDALCLVHALLKKDDCVVVLGVSGAFFIPIYRLFSNAKIITNIDGIEWKRDKWNGFAKWFLKISEKIAVNFSHSVIADNQAIADYVKLVYQKKCEVIPYGGDHVLVEAENGRWGALPDRYCLGLCRIEPENNVELILRAFSLLLNKNIVFIGNWSASEYGASLKLKYGNLSNVHLLDPIYDQSKLSVIRSNADCYIHGHSAGGTNPSLVEMMHFELPVIAFDCSFNRYTTDNEALYFNNEKGLGEQIVALDGLTDLGAAMRSIALERYTWDIVGKQYFSLIEVST